MDVILLSDAVTIVLKHWNRKYKLQVPTPIQEIIAKKSKISDTFCIQSLNSLNLPLSISPPIKATNNDKTIEYCRQSDMKEIFIPLSLQIDTNKNVGFYEINYKIHQLTLQGIKFGLVSSYSEIYKNPQFCPADIVGGYIGIFNNQNQSIICWDGLTQNIINKTKWHRTKIRGILEPNDVISMIVDTKYHLMHLKLIKDMNNLRTSNCPTAEYDICCVPFTDVIQKGVQHITPCLSLLFYKDSIEILSVQHFICKQHSPQLCCINHVTDETWYFPNIWELYHQISAADKRMIYVAFAFLVCVFAHFFLKL